MKSTRKLSFILCVVCNDALVSHTMQRRMEVNDEWEIMWKEVVVA
jgi:hypothetical protein